MQVQRFEIGVKNELSSRQAGDLLPSSELCQIVSFSIHTMGPVELERIGKTKTRRIKYTIELRLQTQNIKRTAGL
jgi:hypothetical protein